MNELGWILRGMAADLNALARVLDELEVERWHLHRYAAAIDWGPSSGPRIEGYVEALSDVLDRFGRVR